MARNGKFGAKTTPSILDTRALADASANSKGGRSAYEKKNRMPRFTLAQFLHNSNEQLALPKLARVGILVIGSIALLAPFAGASNATEQAPLIAIVDFDYKDTSGEPGDQSADHQARLLAFMLRDDLARGGKYRLVSLACRPDPCSITQTRPSELMDQSRHAGARLLLFGGIHKMSTLVQWAKVQAVDLQTGKLVLDRLLTFRGDTDEAWRRAEAFIVEQVNALGTSE